MRTLSKISVLVLVLGLTAACSSAPTRKKLSQGDRTQLLVELASASIMEGDPIAALEHLETAEKLGAPKGSVYHVRALAFAAKKESFEALKWAKKAVEVEPKVPEFQNTVGKLYLDNGRIQDAIVHLKKAAMHPLYRDAYKAMTNLGIAYYRLGNDTLATAQFEKATSTMPLASCHAEYYLGHIALKKNQFSTALDHYDRATKRVCAGFVDAHLAMGIALERGQNYDEARKKFLSVKTTFPNTKAAAKAIDHLRYLP